MIKNLFLLSSILFLSFHIWDGLLLQFLNPTPSLYLSGIGRHGDALPRFSFLKLVLPNNKSDSIGRWRYGASFVPPENKFPGPIDIVYTWVNGSEPRQRTGIPKHFSKAPFFAIVPPTENPETDNCAFDDATDNRYQGLHFQFQSYISDNQELRYSMRSLFRFTPWVRHVFLVTNGQIPSWLNLDHPKLTVIPHDQIFPNKSHLPTFSSPAIEANLHRIPGLGRYLNYFFANLNSQHRYWIYLNDDVMFGAPVYPDDFMTLSHGQRVFLSWPVPECSPGCLASFLGDGYCDINCNVSVCDLTPATVLEKEVGWGAKSSYLECSKGCPSNWLGDKYCDKQCNNMKCAADAGDCGADKVVESTIGISLLSNGQTFDFVLGQSTVYVNMSDYLTGYNSSETHRFEIVDAVHNNLLFVMAAVVIQKEKMLVVVLNTNFDSPLQNVTFSIKVRDHQQKEVDEFITGTGTQENMKVHYSFAISFMLRFSSPESHVGEIEALEVIPEVFPQSHIEAWLTGHRWDSPDSDQARVPCFSSTTPTTNTTTNSSLGEISNSTTTSASNPAENNTNSSDQTFSFFGIPGLFPNSGINRQQPGTIIETSVEREKPIDHYGASLTHVNQLLNQAFGPSARFVPAHMAHFIQSEVIEEMMDFWPSQFEKCSSSQLRSPGDMQFALAYYYFLINHYKEYNFPKVFKSVDTDENGFLDANEVRTLVLDISEKVLEHEEYKNIVERFYECADGIKEPPTGFTECERCTNCTNQTCLNCSKCLNSSHWNCSITPADIPILNCSCITCEECSNCLYNETLQNTSCFECKKCRKCDAPKPKKTTWSAQGYQTGSYHSSENTQVPPPSLEISQNDTNTTNETLCNESWFVDLSSPIVKEEVFDPVEAPPLKLSMEALQSCPDLMYKIEKHFKKIQKKMTDVQKESPDVAFVMVGTNHTDVRRALDGIRKDKQRFICLNDNINHTDPEAELVVKVLTDFYVSLLPLPSPFELSDKVSNPFRYLDELREQYYPKVLDRIRWIEYSLWIYFSVLLILLVLFLVQGQEQSAPNFKRPNISASAAFWRRG